MASRTRMPHWKVILFHFHLPIWWDLALMSENQIWRHFANKQTTDFCAGFLYKNFTPSNACIWFICKWSFARPKWKIESGNVKSTWFVSQWCDRSWGHSDGNASFFVSSVDQRYPTTAFQIKQLSYPYIMLKIAISNFTGNRKTNYHKTEKWIPTKFILTKILLGELENVLLENVFCPKFHCKV